MPSQYYWRSGCELRVAIAGSTRRFAMMPTADGPEIRTECTSNEWNWKKLLEGGGGPSDARDARWTDGSLILIFDLFGGRLRKVAGGFKKKWRETHYLNLNAARIRGG